MWNFNSHPKEKSLHQTDVKHQTLGVLLCLISVIKCMMLSNLQRNVFFSCHSVDCSRAYNTISSILVRGTCYTTWSWMVLYKRNGLQLKKHSERIKRPVFPSPNKSFMRINQCSIKTLFKISNYRLPPWPKISQIYKISHKHFLINTFPAWWIDSWWSI